jgi:glycosyltransferase involved in cell wall biosynthesis
VRVVHVITRLIVGGAQENTVASVLGLQDKPALDVRLLTGPGNPTEGTLVGAFEHCPHRLTVLPSLVRPVHPWRDLQAWRDLVRHFRSVRPDVVHTHSGKAGVLGRMAARRTGVPLIVHTIHGPSFGSFQGRLPNVAFRAAERYAGGCTTHFVSVAHAMTRQYLAAGIGRPEQYTRILSGFALAPFLQARNDPELRRQLGFGPRDFVVGKIARFFKLKGHDDLFAVAPAVVRTCPSVRFLLAGDGPWRERFEARARHLGLRDRFVFTGLVAPSRMPALCGIMDALVHLSRREGLPRALPQALAAARPVVAYDCDGANEVCLDGETGFLIRPGDRAHLTQAVVRLGQDRALGERLGRRGQELTREQFALETMVEELYGLYLRLAQGHPAMLP